MRVPGRQPSNSAPPMCRICPAAAQVPRSRRCALYGAAVVVLMEIKAPRDPTRQFRARAVALDDNLHGRCSNVRGSFPSPVSTAASWHSHGSAKQASLRIKRNRKSKLLSLRLL